MGKQSKKTRKKARHIKRSQNKSLKDSAVSPKTNVKYRLAVAKFFEYMRLLTRRPAAASLTQPMEVDIALCDYLQHLWDTNQTKTEANSVVSGIAHIVPPLTNQLPGAHRLQRAWSRNITPIRATPITSTQLHPVAGYAVSIGRRHLAVAMLLAFHTLLRPIEMLSIRKSHFRLGNHTRGVLLLP